jgi:hypothetical protein
MVLVDVRISRSVLSLLPVQEDGDDDMFLTNRNLFDSDTGGEEKQRRTPTRRLLCWRAKVLAAVVVRVNNKTDCGKRIRM